MEWALDLTMQHAYASEISEIVNRDPSHARDELLTLCLQCFIFLQSPFHVVGMRLGVVGPAFLLEKILHFWNMVLHQNLALIASSASLEKAATSGSAMEWKYTHERAFLS